MDEKKTCPLMELTVIYFKFIKLLSFIVKKPRAQPRYPRNRV